MCYRLYYFKLCRHEDAQLNPHGCRYMQSQVSSSSNYTSRYRHRYSSYYADQQPVCLNSDSEKVVYDYCDACYQYYSGQIDYARCRALVASARSRVARVVEAFGELGCRY
ncbi:hypothetical protein TWF730_003674 [Orbilia blumenaviensis]|uniref:Uncharacterized protein n=1 Tax=Orbilia blumenaviensis TaxID=1796055 RepID=A0AAV9U3K5_9PEZI